MTVSPEIRALLQRVLNDEYSRAELAKWLASNSLTYIESHNETDRMVVTDLDGALGEIQRGKHNDEYLKETANELVDGLGLVISDRRISLNLTDSDVTFVTGTSNSGGTAMAIEVVVVPQSS